MSLSQCKAMKSDPSLPKVTFAFLPPQQHIVFHPPFIPSQTDIHSHSVLHH